MKTAKTAAADTIVAIDLGKYKSVACVHHHTSSTFCFTTFDTTASSAPADADTTRRCGRWPSCGSVFSPAAAGR